MLLLQITVLLCIVDLLNAGDGKISFLVLGDWGGFNYHPYVTPGQKKTSVGMNTVAKEMNIDGILALGDNFYHEGVENEASSRFLDTWANVYTGEALQKDWFVIAGNHDHYGNVTGQIEYSKHNSRWRFPDLYHAHSFESDDKSVTVDVILLDTVELAGNLATSDDKDPKYFDPLPSMPKEYAATQWEWLEEKMQSSTADFLLVGGHFPVYSVCSHGNNPTLVDNLKPLLEKYGAHYMSGHDHCLEHLQENNVSYVLSGLGDVCCYEASNIDNVPKDTLQWYADAKYRLKDNRELAGGFTAMSFAGGLMSITYHDQDGEVLFTSTPVRTRDRETRSY